MYNNSEESKMSTKDFKSAKVVKFIEKCRVPHICTFCGGYIADGSPYFQFNKLIKYYSGKNHPAGPEWPKKCCTKCLEKQLPIFREKERFPKGRK